MLYYPERKQQNEDSSSMKQLDFSYGRYNLFKHFTRDASKRPICPIYTNGGNNSTKGSTTGKW